MSDTINQSASVIQATTSNASQAHKKDIIVSIVLTESTSSLLKLDLPHLEDLDENDSQPTVCSIKAEESIEQTSYSDKCTCKKSSGFTRYWFGDVESETDKQTDCEEVLPEVAYFASNSNVVESTTSLDVPKDPGENKMQADTTEAGSSTSLKQKLKATKVYTRPLFTVNSLAHRNKIKNEANNIYISVRSSNQINITDSGWINLCRICHGGESVGNLLSPCRCRGSIELAHVACLERWLKESASSRCELCKHHFQIIREPKYSVLRSIYVFLRHPGEHLRDMLFDLFAFAVYTPAAVASTYMLMLLCESVAKSPVHYSRNFSAHVVTLSAVFGMAAIDFTYSSWLMVHMQKYVAAWRSWYRNNCEVKLILPRKNCTRRRRAEGSLENEVD